MLLKLTPIILVNVRQRVAPNESTRMRMHNLKPALLALAVAMEA
jgi:hypothetical protein